MKISRWYGVQRLAFSSILLAAAVGVGACSSVHQTYVADGRRGFVVDCGGLLNSWASCLVKAGRACGNKGYDTLKGTEDDRSMLIACKVPGVESVPSVAPPAHAN